jgi:hypothetical protein
LQGPHHSAQKSTTTGPSIEAFKTSASKVSTDPSLIVGAAAFGFAPKTSLIQKLRELSSHK